MTREDIKMHYEKEFASSPHDVSDDEIDFIVKHDCECDFCGKHLTDMDDFPELMTDDGYLLCENCHSDEYRTYCPLCEDSFLKEEITEYFFITKATSKEVNRPVGMYKILKYPFYYGDIVFGFDAFYDDSLEKVSDLNIDDAYELHNPRSGKEILLDCICPDCAERYLRKDNFIKTEPHYCILIEKEREILYKDYSDEKLHRIRQEMIHRRISLRGLIERANKDSNDFKVIGV